MPIGRRRPSLIRTAARTAVVVGTANAVNNRSAEKQAAKQAAEQQTVPVAAPVQQAPAYAAPAQAAPTESGLPSEDTIAKLERLAALHASGALTNEEFAAMKAKVLSL